MGQYGDPALQFFRRRSASEVLEAFVADTPLPRTRDHRRTWKALRVIGGRPDLGEAG